MTDHPDAPGPWSGDPAEAEPTRPATLWSDFETSLRRREGEDEPEAGPPEWALVVYAGANLGRVFPLRSGENLLGRSPQALITLLDEEVSRLHARIRLQDGSGGALLELEDLGSTNGTFLNGQPLKGPRILEAGDRVGLGDHVLKVVALDPLERAFHQAMLDQSTRDSLTGLGNRGMTLAELQSRFELSRRHGRPLCVVMCDLDHFKRINDTLGHGAGDFVLRSFGERLRATLRGADLAGRIGGEEFLIVLPETDLDGALLLAERVRGSLADSPILLPQGPMEVTCSLGVAERCPGDREAGTLMARADEALYRAKGAGRNRVEAARPTEGRAC